MFNWGRKEISRYLVCFIKPLFNIFRSILAFSLLLGVLFSVFSPIQAKAGFFSSVLGDDVYAADSSLGQDVAGSAVPNQGLDTMALLQSNVSLASIVQEKDDKKNGQIDPNTTLNILSDNAILPATGPMGVSDGKDVPDPSSLETSIYIVRKGDSISQIAEMFNVSMNTILWANDMKKGDKIAEGDVLFILPISGVEHTVAKGQTLKGIAKLYKADIDDILLYNDITEDSKLAVGDVLMIPEGLMSEEGGDKPAANLGSSAARDKNYYATHPLKNLIGYFINPVPTGRKTQGLHGPGHRGIDIGAPTGTPIYASASGIVIKTKTGCVVGQKRCGGGYGNMVLVQHPNGTKTLYAHMTKVGTYTGASVSRGDIIGYVGSTGLSTGPHIHFEVYDAKNPGADWSWAH
jgi:murein DD-endopeptidase MepM/ murein hydrolase activator NlpD